MKTKIKIIVSFLFLFSIAGGYLFLNRVKTLEEKNFRISLRLKTINFEGRALSGFVISDLKKKLGKTDSFGEWSLLSYSRKSKEPFFLTLKSSQYGNAVAKRIRVDFENKSENGYFFDEVIKFPTTKNGPWETSTFSRDLALARKIREGFSKINIGFNLKHLEKGPFLKDFRKSLLDEALSFGIEQDLESKWQIFLSPLAFGSKSQKPFLKIISKLPFDNKRIETKINLNKDYGALARKVLFDFRDKVHYPYLIEKKNERWFVSVEEKEQNSLWRVDSSLVLKGYFHNIDVFKNKKISNKGFLFNISHPDENLCQFPDRSYCYLYKLPK